MKTCSKCKESRPLTEFNRRSDSADGYQSSCKPCKLAYNQQYRKSRGLPVREATPQCTVCGEAMPMQMGQGGGIRKYCSSSCANRSHNLRRYYGISPKDYQKLREQQGGRCLICQEVLELVVDHNHVTGEVRGLLCHGCNTGIGLLGEDPARLGRAIDYLKLNTSERENNGMAG